MTSHSLGLSLHEATRRMGVPFVEENEPEDRFVDANGLRFHYLEWRNPSWARHPLRGVGLDAHRRLGRQHRYPHPRRPRLWHPTVVRADREIADRAGQRIKAAIASAVQAEQPDAAQRIKAVVAPYNPAGSTGHVNFNTSVRPRRESGRFRRQILETGTGKCHVNRAVCDTQWEAAFLRVVEEHPKVLSYVKNHGLGLEVPYRIGPATRRYEPDFIVQIDDGQGADDPLNLIVEVKGYRGEDAAAKADTMKAYWIPGVNNLGSYGRWAFHEFTSADDMAGEFDRLLNRLAADAAARSDVDIQ